MPFKKRYRSITYRSKKKSIKSDRISIQERTDYLTPQERKIKRKKQKKDWHRLNTIANTKDLTNRSKRRQLVNANAATESALAEITGLKVQLRKANKTIKSIKTAHQQDILHIDQLDSRLLPNSLESLIDTGIITGCPIDEEYDNNNNNTSLNQSRPYPLKIILQVADMQSRGVNERNVVRFIKNTFRSYNISKDDNGNALRIPHENTIKKWGFMKLKMINAAHVAYVLNKNKLLDKSKPDSSFFSLWIMPRKKRIKSDHSQKLRSWRKNIPILYDTIYREKLECPSYAIRFGHLINSGKHHNTYRLYQSRATNANYLKDKHVWQGLPHALLICNTSIAHKNTVSNSDLLSWSKSSLFDDNNNNIGSIPNNNNVSIIKRIIHPGPILRIKSMIQHPQIVATHTQHKYVFLWNTSTQHDRKLFNNSDPNTPELILKGHKKEAVYALDFSLNNTYYVCSGSADNRVCIWNINDYQTCLSSTDEPDATERFVPLSKPSPKLKPRFILCGHSDEIGDVQFSPNTPFILSSCSHDKSLKIWDLRSCNSNTNGTATATEECDSSKYCIKSINNLHSSSITNLSWNKSNNNLILTGDTNGVVKLLDIRSGFNHYVVKQFKYKHLSSISSLEWNPSINNSNYFLSSSHDGSIVIWNILNNDIVFKHIGHMNPYKGEEVIHGASWLNTSDASDASWCIASTSSPKAFVPFFWSSSSENNKNKNKNKNNNNNINNNPNDISQGGIMHIWRPNTLLNMKKNDILKHIKNKRGYKLIDDNNNNNNNNKKKRKKNNPIVVNNNNNDDDDLMVNKQNNNNNNNDNDQDIDLNMIDITTDNIL